MKTTTPIIARSVGILMEGLEFEKDLNGRTVNELKLMILKITSITKILSLKCIVIKPGDVYIYISIRVDAEVAVEEGENGNSIVSKVKKIVKEECKVGNFNVGVEVMFVNV